LADDFLGNRSSAFAIHSNNLLLAGDDSGFNNRHSGFIGDKGIGRDAFLREQVPQATGVHVRSYKAAEVDPRAEWSQISRHVRRPAGIRGFLLHLDDRNRRLRGNARDASPDELIEHHIANDKEATFRCGGKKML
jgi:hypothetical protein